MNIESYLYTQMAFFVAPYDEEGVAQATERETTPKSALYRLTSSYKYSVILSNAKNLSFHTDNTVRTNFVWTVSTTRAGVEPRPYN